MMIIKVSAFPLKSCNPISPVQKFFFTANIIPGLGSASLFNHVLPAQFLSYPTWERIKTAFAGGVGLWGSCAFPSSRHYLLNPSLHAALSSVAYTILASPWPTVLCTFNSLCPKRTERAPVGEKQASSAHTLYHDSQCRHGITDKLPAQCTTARTNIHEERPAIRKTIHKS